MSPIDLVLVRVCYNDEDLGFAVIHKDELREDVDMVFSWADYNDIVDCLSDEVDPGWLDMCRVHNDDGYLYGHYCWFSERVSPHIGPVARDGSARDWLRALRNAASF